MGGPLPGACLLRSASVSSTRMGRPMTIVPLIAMAFSTNSSASSSTYPILRVAREKKSVQRATSGCIPLDGNVPLGSLRDSVRDDLGVPDGSLSELVLKEHAEVARRELGRELRDEDGPGFRVDLFQQGVGSGFLSSRRSAVVGGGSSSTAARGRAAGGRSSSPSQRMQSFVELEQGAMDDSPVVSSVSSTSRVVCGGRTEQGIVSFQLRCSNASGANGRPRGGTKD